MGQTTSSVARRVTKSVSSIFYSKPENEVSEVASYKLAVTPFVYKRTSSMYFDEDGDLAHEFYEETCDGQRYYMRRLLDNLTPQGEVDLPIPRLNGDLPVILYEPS